jgi:hypothetical protein
MVDKVFLFQIAAGRCFCTLLSRLLSHSKTRLGLPLNMRIKQHYSVHLFRALARLDVPTFDDPLVQRQLESASSPSARSSVAWDTVIITSRFITTALQLGSQMFVLMGVLQDQRDGPLLAVLSFTQSFLSWSNMRRSMITSGGDISHFSLSKHVPDDLQCGLQQQKITIMLKCKVSNRSSVILLTARKLLLGPWSNLLPLASVHNHFLLSVSLMCIGRVSSASAQYS